MGVSVSRRLGIAALLVVAAGIALGAWSLLREDEFEAFVARGIKAIEKMDLEGCMAMVHPDYRDSRGLDRRRLREEAAKFFAQVELPHVALYGMEQQRDGERAILTVRYKLVAGYAGMRGYVLGDMNNPALARIVLARGAKGEWLVIALEGDHQRYL